MKNYKFENLTKSKRLLGISFVFVIFVIASMSAIIINPVAESKETNINIWTTDEFQNQKNIFSDKDDVYLCGTGFLPHYKLKIIILSLPPNKILNIKNTKSDSNGEFKYFLNEDYTKGTHLFLVKDLIHLKFDTFTITPNVITRSVPNPPDCSPGGPCEASSIILDPENAGIIFDKVDPDPNHLPLLLDCPYIGYLKIGGGSGGNPTGWYNYDSSQVEQDKSTDDGFEVYIWNNGDNNFDFVSDYPVSYVWVKGGSNAGSLYVYDPPSTCGCGLNQETQDWSHIRFYYCPPVYGCLDVTKSVVGMPVGVSETFEICITGPSYLSGDCKTVSEAGGVLSWSNLIPGTYTVSETYPGDEWIVSGTGDVEVYAGTPCATATVTNTYDAGCLEVTKSVVGMPVGVSETFEICITGPSYLSGDCKTVSEAGGVLSWSNLIPGTYTVSETYPGDEWIVSGTGDVEVYAGTPCATATVTNTYDAGCLEVTKSVVGMPVGVSEIFEICITGPSYLSGDCKTVSEAGGVLSWSNLIPGTYTVSETYPGDEWIVSGTGDVEVYAGMPCATATVTNTYDAGCLEVTKSVVGMPVGVSEIFEICITGPSYLSGDCKTVSEAGGVLSWSNLIPGTYTVSETYPGDEWIVSGTGDVEVYAGMPCATATVTNTYDAGCLEVTKSVVGMPVGVSEIFEICITGPSYLSGDCKTVSEAGGVLSWSNLIPGTYTVSETYPGDEWIVSGTGDVEVYAGMPCATATVTNTYDAGCLEVTKSVVGMPVGVSEIFEICITGPSYLSGDCKTVSEAGGVLSWSNLIPGTYTVSETYPGDEWIVSGTGDVEVYAGMPCATATVTNTYDAGCLEVTKSVVGMPVGVSEIFEICITGPSYLSGDCKTVSEAGGVLSWSNLIPGTYTVSETYPGDEWIVSGTGDVEVYAGMPCATATVTNTYDAGCLEVTKSVVGMPVGVSEIFEICITGPSYLSGDCKTVSEAGGVLSWSNLIPGTYTVSETYPGDEWIVSGTGDVEVYAGTPCATITITNTYNLGCLDVTKSVVGMPVGVSETFEICITGPSYLSGDCKTVSEAGGVLSWSNLIPGTYTVSETYPGDEWIVSGTGDVEVYAGTPCATATVTNTYDAGCLEVTKSVVGMPVGVSEIFEICITGPSYLSGDCKTVSEAGGVLSWSNLIPGTYTVSETYPGDEWIVSGTGDVEVYAGTPCATITITNTYNLGCLDVTKSVVGMPVGVSETFEICITGPSYLSGDCKTVSEAGGVLSWSNLIPGTYTVSETYPGAEWIVSGEGSVTVDVGTPCATATVTNTYDAGCLEVTKSVVGMPVGVSEIFEICITGPSYLSGDCKTVSEAGGVLSWSNLIPGTYTVSETYPGDEWIVSGTGDVEVYAGTPCATITITNTYNLGCLDVTKSVVGMPVGVSETFEICITGPSYLSGDCKTVSEAGGVLSWSNLIPGTYTVSETYPGAEWIVSGEGSVTVDVGTPCATITITNTYDAPCLDEVWVDDDFHTGTPGWNYDHFFRIQDAVEHVDVNGIVHVYPGYYTGDIILDKVPCDNTRITIEGIYGCPPLPIPGAAVITGSIIIRVDGVTIRNFVFQDNTAGSIIVEGHTGITLKCNVFLQNCYADAIGVYAWEGSYVQAEYNWWGAPNGPNGGIMDDGAIADGYGVIIIGPVYVEPWTGVHSEASASTYYATVGQNILFSGTGSWEADFENKYEPEYLWDFDDGYYSTSKIAFHAYEQPGIYQVSLRVKGDNIDYLYGDPMYDWEYLTIVVT